jgi:hypothetical protein
MALKLFVDISATSMASALVRSPTDMTALPFTELVVGDGREYELYLVDGSLDGGGYATFSGSALYTPLIALGLCGNPSGGTFTLTYDGQTTGLLDFAATPAAVQAALEALSNIGVGDVVVTGVAGKYYKVTFQGALANTDVAEITGDGSQLTPASVVSVDTITPGGGGENEVQLIQLRQNPISYADTWTPIANGWTGKLSTRTLETVAKEAEDSPIEAFLQITVQDPVGSRATYLKAPATVLCTIADPESFAGADKPTFATVAYVDSLALATGIFTRQAASSSAAGNTNITRPAGSHAHTAFVTITGAASTTRTLAVQTTNAPAAGDQERVVLIIPATAGITLEVRDATNVGTLLKSIITDGSAQTLFVDVTYSGAAWELSGDNSGAMRTEQNLAGLASKRTSRANLGTLFHTIVDKAADFVITADDDGTLFRVTTSVSAIQATLPDPAAVGNGWTCAFLKADSAAGSIVTDPATETVSTESELMIHASDGSGWVVLARVGRPTTSSSVGIINLADITALTGGTATDLDSLATADGTYALNAIVMLSYGLASQLWKLVSGTDSEDESLGIVRPDDYATTTNEKVWKKIG